MATLLVTGASGHLGQRVLHHLVNTLNVPAKNIIATTRKPEALSEWTGRGISVRAADFEDEKSLASAFEGAERVLLISADVVGKRVAQHKAAIMAAAKAGAKHIAYTSMPKPENSPALIAPDHLATEQAIAASGIPGWSILRNNFYFENFLRSLPQVLVSGKWFTAAGDGRAAYIARDDLARAAASALASGFAGTRTLTLTGARAFSVDEIAALVSAATAKTIEVIKVPPAALEKGMVDAGLPEFVARLVASLDENTAQGGLADVTGDFKTLTGVDPLPFEAWLEANKAALLP